GGGGALGDAADDAARAGRCLRALARGGARGRARSPPAALVGSALPGALSARARHRRLDAARRERVPLLGARAEGLRRGGGPRASLRAGGTARAFLRPFVPRDRPGPRPDHVPAFRPDEARAQGLAPENLGDPRSIDLGRLG